MDLNLTPEQLKRELEKMTDKVINFQAKPKPIISAKKQKPRLSSGKYGSVNYGNNDNTIRRTT